MENVQFSEESDVRKVSASSQSSGLGGFLIKHGIASDGKSAQYIMLGIAVVALLVSLYFWRGLLISEPVVDPATIPAMPGYTPS